MLHVREHFSNHFRMYTTLRIVSVIDHQTHRIPVIPLRTCKSLAPQLSGDVDEYSAPVVLLSGKKTIGHVLATGGYAA